ncbi:serine hydrolase domain-containing protein [Longimicrobium sp.]|uniref:serine hydrolase domain-containing protein n=1 Tax=Longimicrobium sp. TaxID=2029185 RepID=UPI002E37F249|nr:serine hydrolase domain-containing protein [Longimicrobium sp.]HEX6040792.1 serine hydrolase domain-containing protein [Longimicrobium sp.]
MPAPILHRRFRTVALLAVPILVAAAPVAAQPRTPPAGTLDSLVSANLARDRTVGAVVAITRGDDVLFLQPYGRADVESGVEMRTDAVFAIGSITKQFTAAAILLLRDEGKLSLDDDVTKWLPDFPAGGARLPLRRLLDHTSGIPSVPELTPLRFDPNASPDSVYAAIRRHPPRFAPGAAQMYSNRAYWLLHRVIERASGMTYPQYLERMIFGPLGMTGSGLCPGAPGLPRATGYGVRGGETRRAPPIVPVVDLGSGAVCSTAADMATWLRALHGGRVLSEASYAEMVRPATLADGTPLRYGLGVEVRADARGNRYVGHSGEITGYAARANWYPDARMAIVVLMNSSFDSSPTTLVDELAGQLLPGTPPAPRPFTGDAEALAGTYGTTDGGPAAVQVTRAPDGLAISVDGGAAQPLAWVEGLTFSRGSTLLTFRRGDGDRGPVTELRYDTGTEYWILTANPGRP